MKQSEAWIVQVRSDFAAGERLLQKDNETTYCQAIAKYQQTVEKSVKAMVSAVNDLGVYLTVTPSHLPTKEIDALLALKKAIDNTSVDLLASLFKRHRNNVETLCRLAPKWPEPGQLFARNTEYPFQAGTGWSAPAALNSFTLEEAERARETAWVFHRRAITFAQGVRSARN